MATKDALRRQIEQLSDDDADALYALVRTFVDARRRHRKDGLLARLGQIKIEAEPDFASRLDEYVSGERRGG
jgi:hypothetical protein